MDSTVLEIVPARADDGPAIVELLARGGLDADGLEDHLETTLVVRDNDVPVACAGLERYGRTALLRSVMVAPELQGTGLGRRITDQALALAQELGVTKIYLLTETARDFFARYGFTELPRAEIPAAVQQSQEFEMACAQSSVAMWASMARVSAGFK
ncbi:MAG: arsenic resistance N-acetyltransferase ArsN2 [Candidatus Neomarinimicrobiota bacterium]